MPTPDAVKLTFTLIAVLLLAGTVIRPLYGLLGYTIVMILRPGTVFPFFADLRIELLAGILILLACVYTGRFVRSLSLNHDEILRWFWCFIGVIFASMIFAFDFLASWDWVYEFLKIVAFFIMIVSIAETRSDVNALLWTICVTTTCISYDAIHNFMSGNLVVAVGNTRADYATASDGQGAGHVALANLLLQTLPLIWYVGVCNKSYLLKICGACLFSLSVYGVMVSGSRGGFVGLVFFGLCLMLFSKRKVAVALLFVALLASAPVLMGSRYSTYIGTILDIGGGDVGSDRISGLRNGFEMLLRRPLFGVGPGCYPLARSAWMGWGLWAHNLYGELMGELGLAGTVIWTLYVYSYTRKCLRSRSLSSDSAAINLFTAIAVATFTRLFLGMGTHCLYNFFWYLMGGIVVVMARLNAPDSEEIPSFAFSATEVANQQLRTSD